MPRNKTSKSQQMDLFDAGISEHELLWKAHSEIKESFDRTRRKMFRELKELRELLIETQAKTERFVYSEQALHETQTELRKIK